MSTPPRLNVLQGFHWGMLFGPLLRSIGVMWPVLVLVALIAAVRWAVERWSGR